VLVERVENTQRQTCVWGILACSGILQCMGSLEPVLLSTSGAVGIVYRGSFLGNRQHHMDNTGNQIQQGEMICRTVPISIISTSGLMSTTLSTSKHISICRIPVAGRRGLCLITSSCPQIGRFYWHSRWLMHGYGGCCLELDDRVRFQVE
jgi:hypothetical protein